MHRYAREKFVNKVDVKIKIEKKKENKSREILSKRVIKFIFDISASFSQLEFDKWWQYFKGRESKRKTQYVSYGDKNRNSNSSLSNSCYIRFLINFQS